MSADAYNAYKKNEVTTKTPGQIVVMLYDGAVKFLKQAIEALDNDDMLRKGDRINKAIAIIEELNVSLDLEVGGEVATNLRSLYTFFRGQLIAANIEKDKAKIEEVIKMMKSLGDSWRVIAA